MTSTLSIDAAPVRAPVIQATPPARRWRISASRTLQWVVVVWIAALALIVGFELRAILFIETAPVRFRGDINNAFHQGGEIYRQAVADHAGDGPPSLGEVLRAYHGRYDVLVERAAARDSVRYGLDYPPARLLTMTLWVRSVLDQGETEWRDEHLWPLLHFNLVIGALAAAGAFMVVRYWRMVSRGDGAWNAIWLPLIVALLLWFNLAVLINGHGWPQWDVWLIPFYLWAVYCASRGWWLAAGAVIASGCMLKGQLLLGAPVLLLWPMFRGRWMAVLKALIGLATGMAVLTAVWLIGDTPHVVWLMTIGLAAGIHWGISRLIWNRLRDDVAAIDELPTSRLTWVLVLTAGVAAIVLVIWPWAAGLVAGSIWMGWVIVIVLALAPAFPRGLPTGAWLAALLGMGLWMGAVLFDGSFGWLKVGFLYGTDQHRNMHAGVVYNLSAILARSYGWGLDDVVQWSGQTLQITLRWIYAVLLILLGIATAMQAQRRSIRVLVPIVAVWLVMYAVNVQMHERYLLYAAAFSALLVAVHWGMVLLHIVVTVLSAAAMWQSMDRSGQFVPQVSVVTFRMFPGAGWLILMATALLVVYSLMPERRSVQKQLSEAP